MRLADPDAADERLRKQLDEAEKRAARDRFFTMSPDGTGRTRLPASSTPKPPPGRRRHRPAGRPAGPDDTAPPGNAATTPCRHLPTRPGHRRTARQPGRNHHRRHHQLRHLTRQLSSGALDTGQLTAEAVRRLACDAAILPAVLGGAGQALDVGRQRRLITGATAPRPGPARPRLRLPRLRPTPRWCDAHHIHHWADGGTTSLTNAVLLCGHHHRHLHHSDWAVRLGDDGHPEFIPPAWLDPEQLPRRNHYWNRP